MLYLYDVNGYQGDFGSRMTVDIYDDIVNKLGLTTAIDFFNEGFTVELEQLINDWEQIDFSGFGELQELGLEILEVFKKCKEIVILTEGFK